MKDLKRASARGAAWNLLQNLVSRALGLVVVAVLSRLLDEAAFGGVALALAITSFCELLVYQGYGEFITGTKQLGEDHLDTAFWFNVGLGGLLTVVIAVAAGPLARALGDASATSVIRWTSLSLLLRSLSVVPAGLLARDMRFRELSMRGLASSIVGGVAGISAAAAGLGVYALVIQLLVGDVAATATLWRATRWQPGRRVTRAAFEQLTRYGTPLFGAGVLGFVSRRLDTAIVAGVLGLALLGVYSLAQRIFQILLQVLNKSAVDVIFSALARLQETEEERRHAFYNVVEVTAVICFPTYAGLAIAAEPIAVTLLGERWHAVAPPLAFFALSGVPFSLTLVHMAALKSSSSTRAWFLSNLCLMIVYLPLMLTFVDRGPGPAAAASAIACLAIVPVEIWFLRAALGINAGTYLRRLTPATAATAAMTAAALPVEMTTRGLPPALRLALITGAGAVTYVIALRVFAPQTFRRCLHLVRQTVRRSPAPG
jgi:O-antigen/teichoic acid export membrane protein